MASNRRWRCQFRYRGSRRESAVAQLSTLGSMLIIVSIAASSALLTRLAFRFFARRVPRPYLILLAGLVNAVIWTAVEIIYEIATGLTGALVGFALEKFIVFDFCAILSLVVALLISPRRPKSEVS
jgi:hypothetical protein